MKVTSTYENALAWAENLYWQGLICLDQDLYEEAHRAFSRAIELDPLHSESLYWRGTLASFRGNHEAAAADFCGCLCVEPTKTEAYLKLAVSQRRCGRNGNAFLNFARYIAALQTAENFLRRSSK